MRSICVVSAKLCSPLGNLLRSVSFQSLDFRRRLDLVDQSQQAPILVTILIVLFL
jgi:hypothetical protein